MRVLAKFQLAMVCALLAAAPSLSVIADGIHGSGIIKKRAQRFGSIVIDGVHYRTETAAIRINGDPADEGELKVGYHLTLRGDVEAGEAWSVDYFDSVAGVVSQVSIEDAGLQQASIEVLGQRVRTDADTWFHGSTLEDLSPGMAVAVSADLMPDGSMLASSVDVVARPYSVLSGSITAIDGDTLRIAGMAIDLTDVGNALDADSLAIGERVHVRGYFDGSVLYADRLFRAVEQGVVEMPLKIEGVLHGTPGDWSVRGYPVLLDGNTRVEGPALAAGLEVAIDGTLMPTGELVAGEIAVQLDERFRVDGIVAAINPDDDTIDVDGTTVHVAEDVSMRDDRDGFRWLAPRDLSTSDAVSLVVERRNGRLEARRIQRNREIRRRIQGRIDAAHFWRGPRMMDEDRDQAFSAARAVYNGREVSAWALRWLLRTGDRMALEYDDDGDVSEVSIRSDD